MHWAASAEKEADAEEMPIGSPADHEFVSDSYQTGSGTINADELKKEMDQLGMSDKMQNSSGTNPLYCCVYYVLSQFGS